MSETDFQPRHSCMRSEEPRFGLFLDGLPQPPAGARVPESENITNLPKRQAYRFWARIHDHDIRDLLTAKKRNRERYIGHLAGALLVCPVEERLIYHGTVYVLRFLVFGTVKHRRSHHARDRNQIVVHVEIHIAMYVVGSLLPSSIVHRLCTCVCAHRN
jgi:hypothetical protein